MNTDLIIAIAVLVVVLIIWVIWKKPFSSSSTDSFGHRHYTPPHAHRHHPVHLQRYPPFVHHGIHYDYVTPPEYPTMNVWEIRKALDKSNWRLYICPQAPVDHKTRAQLAILFPHQTITNYHKIIEHNDFIMKNCQGGFVWIHTSLPAKKYVQSLAELQQMSTQ